MSDKDKLDKMKDQSQRRRIKGNKSVYYCNWPIIVEENVVLLIKVKAPFSLLSPGLCV